ncbi:dTDP-4-dehydrorhamnose 3,5-epimerase [Methylocaldum sp.]|uniref:dTDP-4-dehydrorhamnose 3,5-epimerase n=1 Tax=Methylocaldum sp. TaxID=1969727 RepID=UPI00322028CB
MKFASIPLRGAFVVEMEPIEDERGFFARSFCEREFAQHGLAPRVVQCNVSYNRRKGTLRGMHYSVEPHAEAKLVRCTFGAIFDVVVDLRQDSSTLNQWFGVELSAANRRMLFIPPGLAHGFQTLTNDTEVFYQMSEFYYPECARGVRWDDPRFGISWPLPDPIVSDKDRSYPLLP